MPSFKNISKLLNITKNTIFTDLLTSIINNNDNIYYDNNNHYNNNNFS